MTTFEITQEDIERLHHFLSLSKSEFDDLASKIDQISTEISPQELPIKLEENGVTDWEELLDFYKTFGRMDMPSREMANILQLVYDEHLKSVFKITKGEIKRRALRMFDTKNPLRLWLKAFGLKNDYERKIEDVRIITGIRPVFNSRLDENLAGFFINHQLRVSAIESGSRKDYFFSLDKDTLEELAGMCKRALKKQAALDKFLSDKDIQHL